MMAHRDVSRPNNLGTSWHFLEPVRSILRCRASLPAQWSKLARVVDVSVHFAPTPGQLRRIRHWVTAILEKPAEANTKTIQIPTQIPFVTKISTGESWWQVRLLRSPTADESERGSMEDRPANSWSWDSTWRKGVQMGAGKKRFLTGSLLNGHTTITTNNATTNNFLNRFTYRKFWSSPWQDARSGPSQQWTTQPFDTKCSTSDACFKGNRPSATQSIVTMKKDEQGGFGLWLVFLNNSSMSQCLNISKSHKPLSKVFSIPKCL